MANEHTITHFSSPPQQSYNSHNLPILLPISSQGSLGPTVLLSLLFRVKYGLMCEISLADVGRWRAIWTLGAEWKLGGGGHYKYKRLRYYVTSKHRNLRMMYCCKNLYDITFHFSFVTGKLQGQSMIWSDPKHFKTRLSQQQNESLPYLAWETVSCWSDPERTAAWGGTEVTATGIRVLVAAGIVFAAPEEATAGGRTLAPPPIIAGGGRMNTPGNCWVIRTGAEPLALLVRVVGAAACCTKLPGCPGITVKMEPGRNDWALAMVTTCWNRKGYDHHQADEHE